MVLAMEHRDGSGPFVFARTSSPGTKGDQPTDSKMYLNPDDVIWEGDADKSRLALREDQLLFRRLEIYIAHTYFKRLVQSEAGIGLDWIHTIDGPWNHSLETRSEEKAFWKSWCMAGNRPKAECEQDITLTGHSFGGATVLSVLSQPPPRLEDTQLGHIPCTRAITLDPWLEPLPSPGPTLYQIESSVADGRRETPLLLVLNSEAFTLWEDHFDRLKGIVESWNSASGGQPAGTDDSGPAHLATLITLVQAKHVSFSDFGVLIPFGKMARDGRRFLDVTCELADAFIGGGFSDALGRQHQVEEKAESVKKRGEMDWGKKFVGDVGDIILH